MAVTLASLVISFALATCSSNCTKPAPAHQGRPSVPQNRCTLERGPRGPPRDDRGPGSGAPCGWEPWPLRRLTGSTSPWGDAWPLPASHPLFTLPPRRQEGREAAGRSGSSRTRRHLARAFGHDHLFRSLDSTCGAASGAAKPVDHVLASLNSLWGVVDGLQASALQRTVQLRHYHSPWWASCPFPGSLCLRSEISSSYHS